MLVIGIAGGTGSGKTTVVKKIIERLPEGDVEVLAQDAYYRDNSDIPLEERQKINFDHPDAIEFELLAEHIRQLRKGSTVKQPIYSYLTCTRAEETIPVSPKKVVIVEGILCLAPKELRDLMNIRIFVDCEADLRLSRVIQRDIIERGRNVAQVLERYEKTVRPSHLQFIEPTKRYADIIVPQGGQNTVAIDIITQFIEKHLNDNA
ncbi:uridine kinase [Prolixibacter bellariivorans]|uniref:Uridine kinase n=1 Tax=Prolixibacter bellariivorans TaxID=314319 RepID=A0A5M4B087_9BACT|nr:uridine kinase [Prolixibacter bellariivorans]GET33569.1 uridine kinase [Prolixibacter bellariivorans]